MPRSADIPIGIRKGDCHGGPPVALVMRGVVQFGWPATDYDDWCGLYTQKDVDAQ